MTMFKTPQEIVKMAESHFLTQHKQYELGEFSQVKLCSEESYEAGYTQAQQDIKEVCSKGFDECFSKYATESNLHHEFDAHYFWQSAKLSSKAQIDTLKQRELEYQSDLREKDRIINEKSNQIIEITKELQEKDERIRELERKIKSIDCYITADEKYQEAVKDIEFLLNISRPLACRDRGKVKDLWSKYDLDKEEK